MKQKKRICSFCFEARRNIFIDGDRSYCSHCLRIHLEAFKRTIFEDREKIRKLEESIKPKEPVKDLQKYLPRKKTRTEEILGTPDPVVQ